MGSVGVQAVIRRMTVQEAQEFLTRHGLTMSPSRLEKRQKCPRWCTRCRTVWDSCGLEYGHAGKHDVYATSGHNHGPLYRVRVLRRDKYCRTRYCNGCLELLVRAKLLHAPFIVFDYWPLDAAYTCDHEHCVGYQLGIPACTLWNPNLDVCPRCWHFSECHTELANRMPDVGQVLAYLSGKIRRRHLDPKIRMGDLETQIHRFFTVTELRELAALQFRRPVASVLS